MKLLFFIDILLFHLLVTLLRLDGHGRNRACLQAFDADGFAGFFAEAVRTVVDAAQCGIYLADEF